MEMFVSCRPVSGLDCRRSEVSGKRFWGLFQDICGANPFAFFQHCFIYNECPIALLTGSGKNITPAELRVCVVYGYILGNIVSKKFFLVIVFCVLL